jgi:coproporphyrinogen dehydrogenase
VPALQQMADDGLITFERTHIALTEAGSPFVRNVAAALDKMMINNNNRFSKPV